MKARRWAVCLQLALPAGAAPLLVPARAAAQEIAAPAAAGSISGFVLDAQSGAPLPGARIILLPRPDPEGASPLEGIRAITTDSVGAYRMTGLAGGRYWLRIERIGYRPTTLEVELRGSGSARVAVELRGIVVRLEQITVDASPPAPYARRAPPEHLAAARAAATRALRERSLATDAHAVTHADVIDAVTLAESDVLRALQRLPGVTARDDYTAAPWVRGGRWDMTRVYFDGMPLYNPLHAFGAFAGVNTDALGAVFLHPGVRPPSLGDGAAATIETRTRPGGSEPAPGAGANSPGGVAEVSLLSVRAAVDQRIPGDRVAYTIAARRSLVDWLTSADSSAELPYAFADVTGRVDVFATPDITIEMSGLLAHNEVTGATAQQAERERRWGARAWRTTVDAPLLGGRGRWTVGASGYLHRELPPADSTVALPTRSSIVHPVMAVEWVGNPGADGARSSAGLELTKHDASYHGPGHRPLPGGGSERLSTTGTLSYATVWGEQRHRLTPAIDLSAGGRAELGPPVHGGGRLRFSPRLVARWQRRSDLSLSAGVGRSMQYVQAVAPRGSTPRATFSDAYLWLLAGPDVAPIRSDVATLGGEHWLGEAWLASAHLFARRSTGVAIPDPTPGSIIEHELWKSAEERSHGVEAMVRRLRGRLTGQLAYGYGVARTRADGRTMPSPEDRRHALDALARVRLGRWHLGSAYTAMSGPPYTRFVRGTASCTTPDACTWDAPPRTGEPFAQRLGSYESLDVMVEWRRRVRRVHVAWYLQVHNVLGHRNAQTFGVACRTCGVEGPRDGATNDDALSGIGTLPMMGLRLAF